MDPSSFAAGFDSLPPVDAALASSEHVQGSVSAGLDLDAVLPLLRQEPAQPAQDEGGPALWGGALHR
eukprot:6222545-Alexandrium_andersonii.AAC.1